jgi:hypothetical protein
MRMQGPRSTSVPVPGALPNIQRSDAFGCAVLVPWKERTIVDDHYISAVNRRHDVCMASTHCT